MDSRTLWSNEKKFVATAAESNFFEILEKDGLAAKQFILVVYPKRSKEESWGSTTNGMENSWKENMIIKCEEGNSKDQKNKGIKSDNE